MGFVWDAKNNFILLHSIHRHQQESLSLNINWLSIVRDIQLEISSTPILLQNQYEYLLEDFHLENDAESLWKILKRLFLHSLCQQIEENAKSTLEIVYEFTRHIRAKRIDHNDIEQLIQQGNFDYSSDEQKTGKDLFKILNRLRDYSIKNSLPAQSCHETVLKESDDADSRNKQPDANEGEISSVIYRRRSRSLSIIGANQNHKVNIGNEWFVPKFQRQQRSSSLHDQSQSPIPIHSASSQTSHVQNEIVITTISNDESSNSMDNVQLQQTQTKPAISWQPLTNEQILEKERRQMQFESLHLQDLEQISSTDSDSIEVELPISSKKKTPPLSSVDDPHQHEEDSCKRQRICDED